MDNYLMITKQDAEVLVEILHEYPQNVRWTIKGVSIESLRQRLFNQLKDFNERIVTKVEFNAKPTTSIS